MATVYLAEDLKHHRKVAVKVLHPEFAAARGGREQARNAYERLAKLYENADPQFRSVADEANAALRRMTGAVQDAQSAASEAS